jgi:hypothetical protein
MGTLETHTSKLFRSGEVIGYLGSTTLCSSIFLPEAIQNDVAFGSVSGIALGIGLMLTDIFKNWSSEPSDPKPPDGRDALSANDSQLRLVVNNSLPEGEGYEQDFRAA